MRMITCKHQVDGGRGGGVYRKVQSTGKLYNSNNSTNMYERYELPSGKCSPVKNLSVFMNNWTFSKYHKNFKRKQARVNARVLL